jgi:3-hydroxyacyl-CoA dehydrogenase
MKLVEVVQGKLTNPKVVQRCMELAKKIGKIPVLVGVCEGFVGNRILWVRQMQAIRLLKVGVTPWDIDKALNQFGFKMGPFQMSDLAGLDLGWSKGLKTNNPIKDALCEAGRRGQKTSKGYYDYDSNRNASPSEETEKIIKGITKVKKVTMSPEEIIETCIYPMINEAVKILDENKIQRPSDIDVVWLFGYGWPKDKGGPMFYGDKIGSQKVLKKLEELSLVDSSISISKLLYETASNGADFLKIETGGLIPT